eukprot:6331335-Pyramimonas_sp.AAC.1
MLRVGEAQRANGGDPISVLHRIMEDGARRHQGGHDQGPGTKVGRGGDALRRGQAQPTQAD